MRNLSSLILLLIAPSLPLPAVAEDAISAGDTAWMLTSTVLVLFMTLPGLALFYAGMVRSKNVLSVLVQCFAIASLMTLLWVVVGYSLAFESGPMQALIGGFGKMFLSGVDINSISGSIPETVFIAFQMTFFIITPALITGAFAERMKFSATLWFMLLWGLFSYLPICHWVWGGGWLSGHGGLDFAGGTVVHINAGMAGLVAALLLGPRHGYPKTPMLPHHLGYSAAGAAMLWVGWFGFNAGSALAADQAAGMAMLVTQIGAACGGLSWMFVEWIRQGKPSMLGIISGAISGLVAITPAAGFVGPMGAIIIGFAAGAGCFWAVVSLKRWLRVDDSLDVFGIHGIGGIIGALLTGVFAAPALGGIGLADGISSIGAQVWAQAIAVIVTLLWSAIVSYVALKLIALFIGLRVDEEQENEGLDIALHDERGYNI